VQIAVREIGSALNRIKPLVEENEAA